MKNTVSKVFVLAAMASSIGLAAQSDTNRAITVRVYNIAGVSERVLDRAEEIATRAFEQAEVDVAWTGCPTTPADRDRYPDCRGPFGPSDIILRLLPAAPSQFAKRAKVFGAARMSDTGAFPNGADVYFDRVERMTWEELRSVAQGMFATLLAPSECTSLSLGMVVAHEIGHLLLGSHSHSGSGIMKANWSRLEMKNAYLGRQSFLPRQQKSLQKSVLARAQSARNR